MKKLKTIIVGVCVLALAMMLACSSMQDILTPAYIDPAAIAYADANVPGMLPYTSLFDARKVSHLLDYRHLIKTMLEDAEYTYLKNITTMHIQASEEFQERMFSPTGPFGLLLTMVPAGVLGTMAGGRYIKRKGDLTKEEHEIAMNGNHNNNNDTDNS